MSKVLELNDVSMNFCNDGEMLSVLEGIHFVLEEGEIVAIVGPSGAGKSTILNLISGLIKPTDGDIKVAGDIGYMFQRDHLFEWRTIYKNIILGLEIKKKLTEEAKEKVKRMLVTYGLWDFRNNYPSTLSGGMRQRVALIRTLAIDPTLLLLDEPFAALDYQTKLLVSEDMYDIIKKENKSTIIVTHDISEAIAMADRIVVLSHRPARINSIHKIEFLTLAKRTPLATRTAPEFSHYFEELWEELNNEE